MLTLKMRAESCCGLRKKRKKWESITVSDEGGNLVSHIRMDRGIDISTKTAYTSGGLGIATRDVAAHSQSGGQFLGIHASNGGKLDDLCKRDSSQENGNVIGVIGVSGGSGGQDQAVVEAGAAAF
jgi:uncharacterized protein GlcG (DUF336 family)